MLLVPLLLLCALPQDVQELTRQGIQELRQVEADIAAGELTGLDIPDAFFRAALTLRKACEAGGAPAEAYEAWSEALLNADDLKKSLEAVEAGLGEHKKALVLHLQHGRVLVAQAGKAGGDKQRELWSRASAVYAAAMPLDKKAVDACLRLGEVQVYLGDLDGAKKTWSEALGRDAEKVDLGVMVQWLPHAQAAEILDGMLAKKGGEDPLLRWYRGMAAYYSLFKAPAPELWSACKADFEKALELNPAYDSSWFFLAAGAEFYAGHLNGAGDASGAQRMWREAGRAWGEYLGGNAGNQQLNALRGMPDGGQEFVDKMKWFGSTIADPRRPGPTVKLFQWVTRARPDDPEAWNNLALIYRDTGQAQQSLDAYEAALKLQPDDPQVMNDLAVILHYYLKKDDERAAGLYRQAIARADELLAGELEDRERIQTARNDAARNLGKLERGNRTNG
ncbi:MAG: tetratricopeptide repeat protein [Planctomycetes bacterium]|nr:tetratricopeptide repeat protein [Planctomycetota bacterium]